MPTYEFRCRKCDARFEELVRSMTGAPEVKCPKCGSKQTVRELSVFAVGAAAPKSSGGGAGPGMCGRCGGLPGSCGLD